MKCSIIWVFTVCQNTPLCVVSIQRVTLCLSPCKTVKTDTNEMLISVMSYQDFHSASVSAYGVTNSDLEMKNTSKISAMPQGRFLP